MTAIDEDHSFCKKKDKEECVKRKLGKMDKNQEFVKIVNEKKFTNDYFDGSSLYPSAMVDKGS